MYTTMIGSHFGGLFCAPDKYIMQPARRALSYIQMKNAEVTGICRIGYIDNNLSEYQSKNIVVPQSGIVLFLMLIN
jgi:hypothetical protein